MKNLKKIVWFILATGFATGITIYTLSYFVTTPGKILPEMGGDGIKNSFTYLYHSMFGKGYWFNGMNYPYGEHIIYTDGMPILSVFFASIGNVSPETALAVLNIFISTSFVISIIFIYLLLLKFGVRHILSIIFSCLIGIFTPQIFNIQGHYSLCLPCIVPMIFYWSVLYYNTKHWRFPVYVFVFNTIVGFIHPYYAALIFIWVFLYAFGYFIFTNSSFIKKLRHVLPILISSLFVFVLIAIVMKLTDPIKDRPKIPYGYGAYENFTTLKHILLSEHSLIGIWVKEKHWVRFGIDNEGYAYLGIIPIIILLSSSIYLFASIIIKKDKLTSIISKTYAVWLFIAFGSLFISMGLPFKWHFAWFCDMNPFFQYFRVLGRFSWIFYYIFTIYAVILFNNYLKKCVHEKKFLLASTLLIIAIGYWGFEVYSYAIHFRNVMDKARYNYETIFSKHEPGWDAFLSLHNMKKENYQGIILLPFIHVGTEKFWIEDGSWIMTLGFMASLQTKLPIVDVEMSRSSWGQARNQLKLINGAFVEKPLINENKNKKPYLLLCLDNYQLNHDQAYLLKCAEHLGGFSGVQAYNYFPECQLTNDIRFRDSINKVVPYLKSEDNYIGDNTNLYINHFDKYKDTCTLFGLGDMPQKHFKDSIIANIPIQILKDSIEYEFSCWFLLSNKDYKSPNIILELLNANGKKIDEKMIATNKSTDTHGMWFRASQYIFINSNCKTIRCKIPPSFNNSFIALDELLLRTSTSIIISKSGNNIQIMVNNHIFR